MLLTVYDINSQQKAILSPEDSSTQVKALQSDNVLALSFTLYEYVPLDVNDYIDYEGERYWLTERYLPNEKNTQEWKYDVKFYGIESLIKRFLVLNTVDGEPEAVFTLTAPPREHVELVVKSINDGMGTTAWKVGTVEGTDNIVIDYEGKYCHEALKEIAGKVPGTEWWADGQTVNLCRCEIGDEVILAYGKGLTELERDTADNVKFYTRLFPTGSSRNLDPEKYGYSRLQLPGGAKYVDVNVEKYGIIHHYEKNAFADIYPRRIGVVSSVRSEEKKDKDGNPFTIYYFRDSTLNFDPNSYELGKKVKRVSFQEGSDLAGVGNEEDGSYYFEVNFNSDTHEFEIITIWPDDSGMQLPGEHLIPKIGDEYILWNIRMPDEYYSLAEKEYKAAVDKYNQENATDISVYKAPTDHEYIERNSIILYLGRRVRLESSEYFPGTGYRSSRITKITRKVNLPSQMDLEISDALSTGVMESINQNITDVKNYTRSAVGSLPDIVHTGDRTRLTDNNLLSALRALLEISTRAISKEHDDKSEGIITFMRGLISNDVVKAKLGAEFGDFVDSMIAGKGAGIDERGNAQVESLEVRSYMKVMELIINRISAVESDFNFTESGTIDKVEELEPGTYLLTIRKRWDFDFTAFQEHDVVYGSINTLLSDGSYFTSWFRVLSTNTSANTLTVATYPDNEVPAGKNFAPVSGMNISRRGNAQNEDRQSCWYISSFEGCIMYLEGVTKPILDESNYYLSLGKPKHLELFNGLPINYKHPYIFARGAIIQDLLRIDFQGNPVYEVLDVGLWNEKDAYTRGYSDIYGKYIQHQVWYKSCCWRCVTDAATIGLPPRWNNTQWICVVGDSNFTLEITSTKGRFFRFGQEYTTLGFLLKHGEMDISVDAWQVEWTRESDIPEEDLLWNVEHSASADVVEITPQDMPSNWYEVKKVAFRCTVSIRDGEEVQTLTNEFNINK